MSKNNFSCDCNTIHDDVVENVKDKMPNIETFKQISSFFKVLGDTTRAQIMWALDENELCVCDIANVLGMTKSAVSHQLSMLRKENLVKFRREGKIVFYSLADDHVKVMFESCLEHMNEDRGFTDEENIHS